MVKPKNSERKPQSAFGSIKPPRKLPDGWAFVCDKNEHSGNHQGYLLLNDRTLDLANLWVGDYTVRDPEGRLHDRFCVVERKSLDNLLAEVPDYARPRWDRALERMSKLAYPTVVVETDWCVAAKPYYKHRRRRSAVHPNALIGSVISWQLDHRVPFMFTSHRIEGERVTRWILANYAHRVASGYISLAWPNSD